MMKGNLPSSFPAIRLFRRCCMDEEFSAADRPDSQTSPLTRVAASAYLSDPVVVHGPATLFAQLAAVQVYAGRRRLWLDPAFLYVDSGRQDRSAKRGASLERLLIDALERHVRVLLVDGPGRFSPEVEVERRTEADLRACGVAIHDVAARRVDSLRRLICGEIT
jgi:hypothetical protein